MNTRLILASASPQRKILLEGLGVLFEVLPSTVDDDGHPAKSPVERSVILAALKAKAVAAKNPGVTVIGSDQVVGASDGTFLDTTMSA